MPGDIGWMVQCTTTVSPGPTSPMLWLRVAVQSSGSTEVDWSGLVISRWTTRGGLGTAVVGDRDSQIQVLSEYHRAGGWVDCDRNVVIQLACGCRARH